MVETGALRPEDRIGTVLAGHRIDAVAGRGGMGVVYRAEHLHLRRTVALKLLAPELADDAGFRERFLRESRLAAQIVHPNVVTVFDAGEADGLLWISMQYVEGTDLSAALRDGGRMEPARALEVVGDAAAALEAAHARGLVHRDVKPANVLIAPERCYLTDFGLTKRAQAATAFTATGQFVGTIDYVAPEQIQGADLDPRTDVYSLGCVLHECLTGRRPFERDSDVAVLYAHLEGEPPRPSALEPALGPEIDAVLARAMAKRLEDRHATPGALVADARAALAAALAADDAATAARPAVPRAAAAGGASTLGGDAAAAPGAAVTRRDDAVTRRDEALTRRDEAVTRRDDAPTRRDEAPTRRDEAPPPPIPPPRPPARSGAPGDPAATPAPATGRRRALAGAAVAAVVVVAVLALLVTRGSDDGADAGGQAAGGAAEPGGGGERERPRLRGARTPVGDEPVGVAAAGGRVWVANSGDGTVSVLDAASRRPLGEPIEVGDGAYGLTVGRGTLWVANSGDGTVRPLDAASGRPGEPIAVGAMPTWVALAPGGRSLWVSNSRDGTVQRVDTAARTAGEPIEVGGDPRGIATTPSSVWVANRGDGTLTKIDLASGEVALEAVPVGDAPNGIAIKDGVTWVANSGDGTVSRLDNSTGEPVGDPVEVGGNPFAVWVAEEHVLVTDERRGTLTRIDPSSGEIVGDPVPVAQAAAAVRTDAGAIWVVDRGGDAVVKLSE